LIEIKRENKVIEKTNPKIIFPKPNTPTINADMERTEKTNNKINFD